MSFNLAAYAAGFFDRLAEVGVRPATADEAAMKLIASLERVAERSLSPSERVLAELQAAFEFNSRKASAELLNATTASDGTHFGSEADARLHQRRLREQGQRNVIRFASALSRAPEVQS
jgi:hypothetical protein